MDASRTGLAGVRRAAVPVVAVGGRTDPTPPALDVPGAPPPGLPIQVARWSRARRRRRVEGSARRRRSERPEATEHAEKSATSSRRLPRARQADRGAGR